MLKSVSDTTPNVGSTVTFTLQIDNNGPDAAVGASVVDVVPAGFSSVTAISSPTGSSFTVAGNTINWSSIDVPVGGSVSATFSAVVLRFNANVLCQHVQHPIHIRLIIDNVADTLIIKATTVL